MTVYNPYCELCDSCGEDGCCSHIGCFSTLVKNPKCKYGESYVKDAILHRELSNMCIGLIEKFKANDSYTREQFLNDYEMQSDKIYDKRFE